MFYVPIAIPCTMMNMTLFKTVIYQRYYTCNLIHLTTLKSTTKATIVVQSPTDNDDDSRYWFSLWCFTISNTRFEKCSFKIG